MGFGAALQMSMFYGVMFTGNSKIHSDYGEDTNYYKSIN